MPGDNQDDELDRAEEGQPQPEERTDSGGGLSRRGSQHWNKLKGAVSKGASGAAHLGGGLADSVTSGAAHLGGGLAGGLTGAASAVTGAAHGIAHAHSLAEVVEAVAGLGGTEKKKRAYWKQPPHAFELFFDLAFAAAFSQAVGGLGANITPENCIMKIFVFCLLWFAWVENMLYSNFTRGSQADSAKVVIWCMVVTILLAASAMDGASEATWKEPLGKVGDLRNFAIGLTLYNIVLVVAYIFHVSDIDKVWDKFMRRFRAPDGRENRESLLTSEISGASSQDSQQSILMVATHLLQSVFLCFGLLTDNPKVCVAGWITKIGVNFLNIFFRQQLVELDLMDPPSPTHISGRLTRITLIMLAGIFKPAATQWGAETAWYKAEGHGVQRAMPLPWPLSDHYNVMNLIVLLDILGVYCVWCLAQHAHAFAKGQNYKGHLYRHTHIHGFGVAGIAMINSVSIQFYRFSLCQASSEGSDADQRGPGSKCYSGGKMMQFYPYNSVLLLWAMTLMLMCCGLFGFGLVVSDLRHRVDAHSSGPMGEGEGEGAKHSKAAKQCAVAHAYSMFKLYCVAVATMIIPVPYVIYSNGNSILPHVAGHPAVVNATNIGPAYGSGESFHHFVNLAALYVAYKLVPLWVLIAERLLDKRHKRLLKIAKRIAARDSGAPMPVDDDEEVRATSLCACCCRSKARKHQKVLRRSAFESNHLQDKDDFE